MKFAISSILAAASIAAVLSSCNEDPVQPPVPEPEGGIVNTGDGSWERPVSAYQASLGFDTGMDDNPIWVTGFIVGWINTDGNATHTADANTSMFEVPASSSSNLLIATTLTLRGEKEGDPDVEVTAESGQDIDWSRVVTYTVTDGNGNEVEKKNINYKECASVQLPSGSVRNALNLQANPGNLGKVVSVYGTTGSKYCGLYGVRSCSAFNWGNKGYEVEAPDTGEPVAPIVARQTFVKVTSADQITPGQYLLVFGGDKMVGPYQPTTDTHGYLPVVPIAPENNKIVTSTKYAISFYKAPVAEGKEWSFADGFELRDAYGRFIWWSTYSSFQLTPSKNPGGEGMAWSLALQSNGTFAIKNIDKARIIQYSSQYGNVSAYSSGNASSYPVLYKRIVEENN